jgi:serine/threonine protein kinase
MPSQPLKPGDPRSLSRFELLARLGEGGQGVVYLGRGTGPGEERVAVKVLRSDVDPMMLERLGRELDAVHQVQPFVTAGLIETAAEGDRRFIVSEFIDGPSLQERVDAGGPLPEGDLRRLAVGTATALTAIHGAGVVHRDFKPANVLLGPDGPRVVDFGIARLTDAATITSGVIGTPSYMAPEQLSGARPTSAVDIFAWAVTIVFAATGRPAFNADSIPAVMHHILFEEPDVSGVPLALRPVVSECLDKDPHRRPSARDLLLRLVDPTASPAAPSPSPADLSAGPQPVRYEPGSHPEPTQPARLGRAPARSRRKPILIASAAGVACALVAGIVLLLTHAAPPRSPVAPSAKAGPSDPAPTSSPSSSSSTGPPSAALAIPAAYAGTWAGTATMSASGAPGIGLPSGITFTFAAGARTIHEVNDTCVNTLTLSQVTAKRLTFSEPATPECVAGTVTFSRHGARLAYRWTNNIEQNTALLAKS